MNFLRCIKLILLVCLVTQTAMTQTWISTNAVWHYNFESLGGVRGYHKISYIKDTVVNGQACEYLQVIQQSYAPSGPPNWNYVPLERDTLEPRFTFMRNDTVYYYNEGAFSILYCLSAAPGQSWDLGIDTNDLLCSRSIVHVDYTDMINLNGQNWPMLFVSSSPDASAWLYGRVVSRFGAYDRYLFPLPNCCDSSISVDFQEFFFNCFEDDDFPLIQLYNYDCDNPLAVGIAEPDQMGEMMVVYPNPATQLVHLRIHSYNANHQIHIVIKNFYGQEIYSQNISDKVTHLDISGFPVGLYYIILFIDGLPVEQAKLIIH